jgi:hypothetical protein
MVGSVTCMCGSGCEGNLLVLHEVGNGDGGEQAPAIGDGAPHGHTSWLRGGLSTTMSRLAFAALESMTTLGLGEHRMRRHGEERSRGRRVHESWGPSRRCNFFETLFHVVWDAVLHWI